MRSKTLIQANPWEKVTQLWCIYTEVGTEYSWAASKIQIYELESLEQVLPVTPFAKPNNGIWKLFFPYCVGKKDDHAEGGSRKNGKGTKWICNDELKCSDRKNTT